jgi:predicted MPP superfamily phosphohydrolase
MTMISRRLFLKGAGGFALATAGLGSYAFALEPGLRCNVTSYRVTPPRWPDGLSLKAVVLTDIHACEPWMPASRVQAIAELANRLNPDIIFLLGDYNGSHMFVTGPVLPDEWAEALSILKAPLGVFAVLGNHDFLHGPLPNMPSDGGVSICRALRRAGCSVLENKAVRLKKDGQPFWVAGLGDQIARRVRGGVWRAIDDLPGTLAQVKDSSPVLLLAHEPYVFRRVPDRVSLTLCGHTHGGQVNLPVVGPPFLTADHWKGLIYGHIVEKGRHLIISAGLGTSHIPVRFLRPPEIVEVTIGEPRTATPAVS